MVKKQLVLKDRLTLTQTLVLILLSCSFYLAFRLLDFFLIEFFLLHYTFLLGLFLFLSWSLVLIGYLYFHLKDIKKRPQVYFDQSHIEAIKPGTYWTEKLERIKILSVLENKPEEPKSFVIQTPWGPMDLAHSQNWPALWRALQAELNKKPQAIEKSQAASSYSQFILNLLALFSYLAFVTSFLVFEQRHSVLEVSFLVQIGFLLSLAPLFLRQLPYLKPLKFFNLAQIQTLQGILALPLFLQFFWFHVVAPLNSTEAAKAICGNQEQLRQCYQIDQNTCLSIWEASHQTCYQKHVATIRKEFPMRLPGPLVNQCKEYEFDRSLKFMRNSSNNSQCSGLFERIENYKLSYIDN